MRPGRRVVALAATVIVAASCGGGDARPGNARNGLVPIGAGLQGPRGTAATVYARARGLTHVSALTEDSQARVWAATADYTDHGRDAVFLVARPGAAPVSVIAGL